jgi:uncharacterized protein
MDELSREFADRVRKTPRDGVTFVEAMTAFLDERGIAEPDNERPGRFVLILMSRTLRVLFVVSAEAGECVRLISARKASPTERKMYENGP